MTSVRRRVVSRLAAVTLTPGLLVAGAVVGAGPAAAKDGSTGHGGATATLNGQKTSGQAVVHEDGKKVTTGAGLFEMSVDDGGMLQVYGVDVHNPVQKLARYEEVPRSASSLHDNRHAGKIRWVLRHSYPQVNDLAKLAKVSDSGRLTPSTAAAGTQVAIWRFSDEATVEAVDPAAEKLADYLEKNARNTPEPNASLTLSKPAVAGESGELFGPITVRTTAPSVTIVPGAEAASLDVDVVGADGDPITTARDGSKLYFDVPEGVDPGSTTLTAQATTSIPVGRVFTGTGDHATSQTILAGSSPAMVSATARANWADSGAIPTVTGSRNCAEGGVDVTTTNKGDGPFRFSLGGEDYEIAPGETRTLTVPVREDQPYEINVAGTGRFDRSFSGVLDCQPSGANADSSGLAPQTGERSGDPSAETATTGGDSEDVNLAETGNSSDTPLIVGAAVGLLTVGAVAMLLVRRHWSKRGEAGSETAEAQSDAAPEPVDGGD